MKILVITLVVAIATADSRSHRGILSVTYCVDTKPTVLQ